MRNFLFFTAVTSMAILSGCSDSNTSQRVDFPTTAGEYVQLYKDREHGSIMVEVARVDDRGKQQIAKGVVNDPGVQLNTRLRQVKVTFENCGDYQLDQPDFAAANLWFKEIEQRGECELGYLPSTAVRIAAKQ
ncbi:hypothetical protein [Pseudomonas sp. HS6]|uniref:hypothetical protein n=1 Tax=Pseudomonas sp. HS6 TaxID=2850559 RepID=UPI0020183ED1|nr:hypothetical protein [Pseudomonas sp. HS6]UQS16400.1 hypothetical protein JJN09_05935 [Pseudomonas sp. HS6]